MKFEEYYLLIDRAKPQIQSFTGNDWAIPDYPTVASGTKEYDFFRLHLNGWPGYDYMAYLRHHGFPSPLLDWTRSPRVAAYFAYNKATDNNVSIFVFAERKFTLRSNREPLIFRLGPYVKTHRRHFLQQSDYTMCLSFEDNEWRFAKYKDVLDRENHQQGVFWKFTLPSKERIKVLRLLDEFNLNELSLFESEEALMKTIALRELYFRLR